MHKEEANDTKKEKEGAASKKERLLYYLIILAIILILAAVSTVLRTNQLRQCLNLVIQQNKASCLSNLAYSTSNASICSYLSGVYAASCYQALAYKLGDAALCFNALSLYESTGISCIQYFVNKTGNISLCNYLPYNSSRVCAYLGALSSQNSSACAFAGANESMCLSSIAFSKALSYKNISYCYNLSETTNRTVLNSMLINSGARAKNIMGLATVLLPSGYGYNVSARDLCMLGVAQELGNAGYCSLFNSSLMRGLCSNIVAPQQTSGEVNYTSLLQACLRAGAFENTCKALVFVSEALSTKNVSICKSLNQTVSWECFAALARAYKNTSYCGYITNVTISNACVMGVTYNITS